MFDKAIRAVFFGALLGFCATELLVACATTQAGKEREAEATYLGEHMRCVDDSDTRAEMNDCRRKVRERWLRDAGITETTRKDGGR